MPIPSALLAMIVSLPSAVVATRSSVNTPSKSKAIPESRSGSRASRPARSASETTVRASSRSSLSSISSARCFGSSTTAVRPKKR